MEAHLEDWVCNMPHTASAVGEDRLSLSERLDTCFTSVREIVGYGIMSTPGVVTDGKVVHAGGVPSRDKIERWLAAGRA